MLKVRYAAFAIGAAIVLFGCARKEAAPTINVSMREIMEPSAEKIWDIASKAYNEIGDGLVPAKITDSDWKEIGAASLAMKERAEALAASDHIVVANANEPLLGSQAVGVKGALGHEWEAVDAPMVQAKVDARLALFKEKMLALAADANAMHRASQTRDAALLYRISSGLDETCDSCHEPFWGTDVPPPLPTPGGERVQ